MKFTHLHLHTHYSLLDGLTKIEELAEKLKSLGMESAAITDHGNMYGVIDFYKTLKGAGVKPIVGCEVYMSEKSMLEKNKDNEIYHLVLLAKNKTGYQNLMKLVSEAHLKGFYYKPRIDRELLEEHADGLICLSGCLASELSRTVAKSEYKEKAGKIIKWHKKLFGDDYYIEIQRHPKIEEQGLVTPRLIALAKEHDVKVVATCDSHYLHKEDKSIHDVLLAVQTGKKLSDVDRFSLGDDDFHVFSPDEMVELFKDLPEAIENTQEVAKKCNLELEFGKIQLPHFEIPDNQDANEYLKYLCTEGIAKRYGRPSDEVIDRLKFELSVIEKTGFASYLLIVGDIINWAKEHDIAVGPGRGSAAGSIICYLLGITNIDPLKYGLLFERFLNPDRISMPDIDMDFDEEKRDEVLGYVGQKYGNDKVAQIITFGTMAGRAAIRDAGRAMDYSLEVCDKIAKLIPPLTSIEEALDISKELLTEYQTNEDSKKLLDVAMRLEGVIRHASTHACGVVISKEKTIKNMPIQLSSRGDGSITTQYSMKPIEELGLLKMDFLGLSNLTIIRKAVDLIRKRFDKNFDIDKIPLNDERTYKLFQEAKTTSVFQLESDGMKRYIKMLKPTELNDIAAMVSLYRPGPMELIPEYIARKHGRSKIEYLHPALEPILRDTYGIMIYQEQLIQAVQALAGFSLAEADVLRKAVGKKIKSLLDEQEGKFKNGAARKGIPREIANKFWSLVEPFNRYGFNKSHAVSYAMIAFQTAYLKAHYPIEYMTAVLNCDSDTVERISELIDEAQSLNIKILPPDINKSSVRFAIYNNEIRFGLSAIKGIGEDVINRIVTEREMGSQFKDISDFIRRVSHKTVNKKILENIAKSGAFVSFANRSTLLNAMDQIVAYGKIEDKELLPPFVIPDIPEYPVNQRLFWEKELLGLFVSQHPIEDYRKELKEKRALPIIELPKYDKTFITTGGVVVSTKKILTKTKKQMMFCSIEDEDKRLEVVVFPNMYDKHKDSLQNNNIVVIYGKIEVTDGEPKLICYSVEKIATLA